MNKEHMGAELLGYSKNKKKMEEVEIAALKKEIDLSEKLKKQDEIMDEADFIHQAEKLTKDLHKKKHN